MRWAPAARHALTTSSVNGFGVSFLSASAPPQTRGPKPTRTASARMVPQVVDCVRMAPPGWRAPHTTSQLDAAPARERGAGVEVGAVAQQVAQALAHLVRPQRVPALRQVHM